MTDGNLGESRRLEKGFRSEVLGGLDGQGSTTPRQTFRKGSIGEGPIGLVLRFDPNRWLSFTVGWGSSGYGERRELALKRGGNGRQLVNDLAFALDAAINDRFSLVARPYHRSGI